MSNDSSQSARIALTDGSLIEPLLGKRNLLNGDALTVAYQRAKISVGGELLTGAPEKIVIVKRRHTYDSDEE